MHQQLGLLYARQHSEAAKLPLRVARRDFICHFSPLYSTHRSLPNKLVNHLNASSRAWHLFCQSVCGSDNLTILTNMTCDWLVQADNAPAPFHTSISGSNVQYVTQSESVLDKSLVVHDCAVKSEMKLTSSLGSLQREPSRFCCSSLVADNI